MYRTIVVYFEQFERVPQISAVSFELAKRFDARLVGLFLHQRSQDRGTGNLLSDEAVKSAQNFFERTSHQNGIKAELHQIMPGRLSLTNLLLPYARCADLIVMDDGFRDDGAELVEIPIRTAIESGRPTVVLPSKDLPSKVGQRILIAWNGSREAARAVFDALPFLKSATTIQIISIATGAKAVAPSAGGRSIARSLAQHGVQCKVDTIAGSGLSIGNALLRCMEEGEFDLMVMGCYGRSQIEEYVFGGVTRHIMSHLSVPVFLSH